MEERPLGDADARLLLTELRWDGRPLCPRCGRARIASIRTRNVYRCGDCRKEFTVTTGTVFANHKLTHSQIVQAMVAFEGSNHELRPVDLQRLLGVTYKTALILTRKMAEAYRDPEGILASPSYLSRWYWQGFNFWRMEEGVVIRERKHSGQRRLAFPEQYVVQNA